ncbi:MAG: hypothetical protein R3E83_25235 [Burkholderiaceae bacterium]
MLGLTLTRRLLSRRSAAGDPPRAADELAAAPDGHASAPEPSSPTRLAGEHALQVCRLAQLRVAMVARYAGQAMPRDLHNRTR